MGQNSDEIKNLAKWFLPAIAALGLAVTNPNKDDFVDQVMAAANSSCEGWLCKTALFLGDGAFRKLLENNTIRYNLVIASVYVTSFEQDQKIMTLGILGNFVSLSGQ